MTAEVRNTMFHELVKIDLSTMADYVLANLKGGCDRFNANHIVDG